jgi:acylphosphatase
MTGRRLRIHGRVQGVFYRAWAVGEAQALGLSGWVRNRRDGTVELAAWGSDDALDALLARCREGPPSAQVERIDVAPDEGEAPDGFAKAPTL